MAAIDEIGGKGIDSAIKSILAILLWDWIDTHEDDVVFTVRIWIISKTFKVRDLEPFTRLLLGPKPAP